MPLAAAAVLGHAALEWHRGRASMWLGLQALVAVGVAVFVSRRFSHRTHKLSISTGLTALAVSAMLHYGPLMGTGLLCVAAMFANTFFWRAPGAFASFGILIAAWLATALGFGSEASRPPGMQFAGWVRVGLATFGAMGYVTYLFHRLLVTSQGALREEVRAIRRHETAMQEREKLMRAAEATERLDSLGRMARGVAHDFNNALQVIQMGTSVLRSQDPSPEDERMLADIEKAARHASGTVRELLTFSRQAPHPEGNCAPAALIERMRSTLVRMLPRDATLRVEGVYEGEVAVAESELEQVVLSLLAFSRDDLPPGATVRIYYAEGEDGSFDLVVEDDGEGLEEETRARLFEPFFTTSGADGARLGLATVWGIVTRASGTIEVTSAPGAGTSFNVSLPTVPPDA